MKVARAKRGRLTEVTIYTDGGCLRNPGPGGYGVVLIHGNQRKELSGGFRLTTNNRMEIIAAIEGLRALKTKCKVTLYSDSQYLVNAMTKGWARRWQANDWMRNEEERALNPDLWEQLLDLCSQHEVEFVWIRGHTGNAENERCDKLCKEAAKCEDLSVDVVYEKGEG
jgi:ribonuclease HI